MLDELDSEIKDKIDALIVLYKKEGGGIPVDLERLRTILETLINKKVEVKFEPSKFEAIVLPLKGGFLIKVNSDRHPFEQRLSFSHEMAHILFTFDDDEIPRRIRRFDNNTYKGWPSSNKKEEEICDEIAMYLLCPPAEVEKFLKERFFYLPCQIELFRAKQRSLEIMRLEQMAKEFEVPKSFLVRHIRVIYNQSIKNILVQFSI